MAISTPLSVDDLLTAIEEMPAQQAAAVRVLHVSDDPMSSAGDLAAAVGVDPVLTAQVMRLANSAYYGLSGRIRSADFAVTVVGFQTVRSLAAAFAAGALGDDAVTPPGFWEHAAASAAACATIAQRVGVARPDAFSVGLLHDLGAALLCRLVGERAARVRASAAAADTRQVALLERREFGLSHATAAGAVLASWHFPDDVVEAIGGHHDVLAADPAPLLRLLRAGEVLARLGERPDDDRTVALDDIERAGEPLGLAGVAPDAAWGLSRTIRVEAESIAASFR